MAFGVAGASVASGVAGASVAFAAAGSRTQLQAKPIAYASLREQLFELLLPSTCAACQGSARSTL